MGMMEKQNKETEYNRLSFVLFILLFIAVFIVISFIIILGSQFVYNAVKLHKANNNLIESLEAFESFNYNYINNRNSINLSEFNYGNIGSFCKTKESKDYVLNYWWDGCGIRGGEISFTCGFLNSDGAVKYECHTISELNEWLIKQ